MSAVELIVEMLLPNGPRARRRSPPLDAVLMTFGLLAGAVTGFVVAQELTADGAPASLAHGYFAVPALLTFALGLLLGKRFLHTALASLTALGTAAAVMAAVVLYEFVDAITLW